MLKQKIQFKSYNIYLMIEKKKKTYIQGCLKTFFIYINKLSNKDCKKPGTWEIKNMNYNFEKNLLKNIRLFSHVKKFKKKISIR